MSCSISKLLCVTAFGILLCAVVPCDAQVRTWRAGPFQLRAAPVRVDEPQQDDKPSRSTSDGPEEPDVQLKDMTGKYWIGIVTGPVEPVLRAHLDIPEDAGLVVAELLPESPAEEAGLKQYDILLRANNKVIASDEDLLKLIEDAKGGKLRVELLRGGKWQARELKPELVEDVEKPSGPMYQIRVGEKTLSFPANTEYSVIAKAVQAEMERQRNAQKPDSKPPVDVEPNKPDETISVQIEERQGRADIVRVTQGGQTWVTTIDQLDLLPEGVREPVQNALNGPDQPVRQPMYDSPFYRPGAGSTDMYPGAGHGVRPGSGHQRGGSQREMDESDWARLGVGLLQQLMQPPANQPAPHSHGNE